MKTLGSDIIFTYFERTSSVMNQFTSTTFKNKSPGEQSPCMRSWFSDDILRKASHRFDAAALGTGLSRPCPFAFHATFIRS